MILSLDRPENEPSFDVFGHNQKRPLTYANVSRYLDSGADRDWWGSLFRSGVDQSAGRAKSELRRAFGGTLGTQAMLSVDQFLRLISVPAFVAAFLIASQVSGAGIFHTAHTQITGQ
jgi:hypothetical protein